MKTVSEESASAAELETPHSMDEAMETGFLPDDEHYRLTGEFKPEKTDASAAATKKENESEKEGASAASGEENDESENDDASAASSSKAAASETAQPQNQGRRENRWQKRERELRELKAENARLKSQSSQPQPRSETQQASQPANGTKTANAAPKPKIDDVDPKTGKAKYANWGAFEDAKDAWLQDEAVRKFSETQAKTQQLTEQQQREREIGQSLTKKFEPVRAKYADFDKFALNDIDLQTGKPKYSDAPVLTIPKGSAAETFFMDSENAGEVLYYLGHHPEILNDCYSVNKTTGAVTSLVPPARVFRKLMEIETSLTGSGSGANGESSTSSSSAKPVTQASRPPHQVSGKGTVAKDAVEQALDDGDFETYQRTQNAKELARLKKK